MAAVEGLFKIKKTNISTSYWKSFVSRTQALLGPIREIHPNSH